MKAIRSKRHNNLGGQPFWLIKLEEGESVRKVLLAIARASFETAQSGGMGRLHYSVRHTWDQVKGDVTLNLRPKFWDDPLLSLVGAGEKSTDIGKVQILGYQETFL